MADSITRCRLCGGPIGEDGRTLLPVTSNRSAPLSAQVARAPHDDPPNHLTPAERFARAVERRDVLVRDRRAAGQRGRRETDSQSTA
jgi:hypothetical protein